MRASSVRLAATTNVAVKASPIARGGALVIASVPTAVANRVAMTEAPVMKPKLRERPSNPDSTPRCSSRAASITRVLFAARNS